MFSCFLVVSVIEKKLSSFRNVFQGVKSDSLFALNIRDFRHTIWGICVIHELHIISLSTGIYDVVIREVEQIATFGLVVRIFATFCFSFANNFTNVLLEQKLVSRFFKLST